MVKAKQRASAKHHLLIPSLFGVQVEAICWQLSHPSVFPLAHTCISFFPKIWEAKLIFFLKSHQKPENKIKATKCGAQKLSACITMAEASSVVQMLAMSELISTVIQQEAERKAGSFCSLPNINIT